MPISLKALYFPFHFHLILVSLGKTGRNLLRFYECQPVWVKPPVCTSVWPRLKEIFFHPVLNVVFEKYEQNNPKKSQYVHKAVPM